MLFTDRQRGHYDYSARLVRGKKDKSYFNKESYLEKLFICNDRKKDGVAVRNGK